MAEGGRTIDFLRAEHGFPALVEVQDGGGIRRMPFDAGVGPDGLITNLDRLALPPTSSRRSPSATGTSTTSWAWPGGWARATCRS
jgi:hypothetical protein